MQSAAMNDEQMNCAVLNTTTAEGKNSAPAEKKTGLIEDMEMKDVEPKEGDKLTCTTGNGKSSVSQEPGSAQSRDDNTVNTNSSGEKSGDESLEKAVSVKGDTDLKPKESSAIEKSAAGNDKVEDTEGEAQSEAKDGSSNSTNKEVEMDVDGSSVQAAEENSPTIREAAFTSEKFKIEVLHLPKQFGFGQLKKRLTVTLGLKPHKLKAINRKSFAYVCFSSEEDRQQALDAINGHIWKGQILQAKPANPAGDPMKRKLEDSSESERRSKRPLVDTSVPPSERLRSSVEPLWNVPYENQLKLKTETAKGVLKAIALHSEVKVQFMKARVDYEGMCCPLKDIIRSEVMEGYRNKSEFSVGRSEDGDKTMVGFRFGLYKDGSDAVESPSLVSIVSADSKKVVESFEKFVRQSQFPPFNHRTHSGHWRQLTVRTSQGDGGTLAVAEFVVNDATKDQMDAEKQALQSYFTDGEGKAAQVTTFFFRPCTTRTSNSTSEEPYELIYGDGHIHETMSDLNMKFRISPSAFFQVNTVMAEKLYGLIIDWCQASPTTTVLDICCGTGTIGQCMAKNVAKVIGIEMCKEAVEDAKINAGLNGVTNIEYHCAKVEHVITDLVRKMSSDCVAILDPPRGGLHPTVIKSLRTCFRLNRIVYAACNPAGAKQNFIDLCRPKSKKTRGEPFKFVRAQPVDMFPRTKHFELLVLFERQPPTHNSSSSDSD